MTAQVDLVSVHSSESPCLSPATEEPTDPSGDPSTPGDPSTGDPPATDPSTPENPPASDPADAGKGGCGSVLFAGGSAIFAALAVLLAVVLVTGRKKEQ